MSTELLKSQQVATVLKISKAMAYKLIQQGDIPSVRFGRTVRVKSQDLDAFIEANTNNRIVRGFEDVSRNTER